MAVRSRLPWPWRVVIVLSLAAIVGGMWWWGFDFGQIFGGFNRKEVESKLISLESENARLRSENQELRAKGIQQESELAITAGARTSLSKQALELQNENSQIKEELVFLQQLVADSNKQVGLGIQRLAVERDSGDDWHYSLLMVRGGSPKDEFDGHLALQVTLQPDTSAGQPSRTAVMTLPDEDPASAATLKLKFKYYQRVEGNFRAPPGAVVRSVVARAFENGETSPRATRTLVIP
jgi:hypothetical protein